MTRLPLTRSISFSRAGCWSEAFSPALCIPLAHLPLIYNLALAIAACVLLIKLTSFLRYLAGVMFKK